MVVDITSVNVCVMAYAAVGVERIMISARLSLNMEYWGAELEISAYRITLHHLYKCRLQVLC